MANMSSVEIPVSLGWAHPLVAEWFARKFGSPTEPQEQGWPEILAGRTTLISAPTGSGKTLSAFLICIDRLVRQAIDGSLLDRTEVHDGDAGGERHRFDLVMSHVKRRDAELMLHVFELGAHVTAEFGVEIG